jgi:glycosyltransferase involved in cell wall biosynthesis
MTVDLTTPSETGQIPLSVVIIAENEEEQIRECIQSVFDACRGVEAFEVILVDSSSTDRTVERALEYPITVLRIPEEHTVSCGAGRYVGDRIASGEMVLHIDGDMTLTETWLPLAMERLRDPDVAAVEGCLDRSTQTEIREVDKVGGVMLYDAAALREIGGFDPYLLGYEDIDVGFQLRDAGYRLLRLPTVSAIHHDEGAMTESVRRWRQGYLIAPGQTIRKWAGSPTILWRLIRRQRYELGLLAWICAGAVAAISTPLAVGWLLLSVLGVGVVASKRGVRGAVDFFMAKCFGLVGLAVGLRHRTREAAAYPVSAVEVVAEGSVHVGARGEGARRAE